MAIVMPLLSIQAIHAQTALSVDPAAVNQAAIGAAANGVPIIDIVAPNGAGVSHNKFTDYNVGAAGLILNNSNTSVQTQLGGLVSGNAQLGGAPARVILNEVTGSNASRLGGTTEIAGQAAHLIVANPNGITADGVGFVNATRATLVAGHPVLGEDGNVSGFRTDNGRLAVEGSGIDGSGAQELDLIARSLQVNAEIRAIGLNIEAGEGEVRFEEVTRLASSLVRDSKTQRPEIAIDVSQLGSLHADSIRLVGSSAGVGVNVVGKVDAKNLHMASGFEERTSGVSLSYSGAAFMTGDTFVTGDTTVSNSGSDVVLTNINNGNINRAIPDPNLSVPINSGVSESVTSPSAPASPEPAENVASISGPSADSDASESVTPLLTAALPESSENVASISAPSADSDASESVTPLLTAASPEPTENVASISGPSADSDASESVTPLLTAASPEPAEEVASISNPSSGSDVSESVTPSLTAASPEPAEEVASISNPSSGSDVSESVTPSLTAASPEPTEEVASLSIAPSAPVLPIQSIQAKAALTADSAAARRPTISASANGVPIVNIVAPNGTGLSHNKFTDYNVGVTGLILNNSNWSAQTRLGGEIGANAQLGNTAARVILNEVTGGNASTLAGTTEIAGRSAHLIVANPNGITANGAGFINATRATLVAGTTVLDKDGGAAGFKTDNGRLIVEGNGIDGQAVNQLDLIARNLQVNAEVRAATLNVAAHKGTTTLGNTVTTVSDNAGDNLSDRPDVAIDVSKLGSLHADSIRLLGSSAGVGVNVTGKVAANYSVSASGGLVNEGTVTGDRIDASGSVSNAGTISGGSVSVSGGLNNGAQGVIASTGRVDASGSISNDGKINANGISLSGGLKNGAQGAITSAGRVDALGSISNDGKINANGISLSGDLKNGAQGAITSAGRLDASGSISNDGKINASGISLSGGLKNGAQGAITSAGRVDASGSISNDGKINANGISLSGGLKNGAQGAITSAGRLDVSGSTSNDGKINADGISLSGNLNNGAQGVIASKGGLDAWGSVSNAGALNGRSVSVSGSLTNAAQGIITSEGKVNAWGGKTNSGRIDEYVTSAPQGAALAPTVSNGANQSASPQSSGNVAPDYAAKGAIQGTSSATVIAGAQSGVSYVQSGAPKGVTVSLRGRSLNYTGW
ncbi:two-partner secretion domain-containing protein [Paraburkholderia megapolitana]|uniref:two-partner secretion domain-containing protein n=1 Tax=Paraburkholderia megapolitana TaxID=420953 RepID=UPI0038B7F8A4